ncbi:MAG: MOSC domain-containing protein [Candidatus Dormibacteraceae bacterium]
MANAFVSALHVYPLKGGRALDVDRADVSARGIAGDRRYMAVDANGRFISQREVSRLAQVTALLGGDGLRLSAPGAGALEVPLPADGGDRCRVRLWEDDCDAVDQGEEAARWLTDWLGLEARLVHQPESARRIVDQTYAVSARDTVSFADGYPLLVCSTASLADLNAHLQEPLPMNRFRPSLVVDGWPEPWWEDGVVRLRAGEVELTLVKQCARCVVTTVDQRTAERGREPLRTLARIRRRPRGAMFGENAIPTTLGRIRIGDQVETLEWSSTGHPEGPRAVEA